VKFNVKALCLVRSKRVNVLEKSKSLMLCYLLRLEGTRANTSTVSELLQRLIAGAAALA
jgi:hypothetical protein